MWSDPLPLATVLREMPTDQIHQPIVNEEFHWYALHVSARHEKSVSLLLRAKGFEELSPLYNSRRKWGQRYQVIQLPLFPGYVFSRFDREHRIAVLNTPGVIDVVRFGSTIPAVDPEQIAALRRVVEFAGVYEPWPHIAVGERVKLEDGPLVGLEGIVLNASQGPLLVVSVTLLRRSVAIQVRREWIKSLNERQLTRIASAWETELRSTQTGTVV